VSRELLRVLAPAAIQAAAQAAQELGQEWQGEFEAMRLELEAARFEAARAQRQYDAVDPQNRLVAGELEARWNKALENARRLQERLEGERSRRPTSGPPDLAILRTLAEDLDRVWNLEPANIRLKKRIARMLIEEVIVDLTPEGSGIELVMHWKGGVHTRLRVARRRRGQHLQATSHDTVDAICVLARVCIDERIAQALNRSGLRTAKGNLWTRSRVKDVRRSYQIAVHDPARQKEEGWLKLGEAATYLRVAPATVRRYVELGKVEALHPVSRGPWVLRCHDLDHPEVRELFEHVRAQKSHPEKAALENVTPLFSGWR
jgi:hypothetical protein